MPVSLWHESFPCMGGKSCPTVARAVSFTVVVVLNVVSGVMWTGEIRYKVIRCIERNEAWFAGRRRLFCPFAAPLKVPRSPVGDVLMFFFSQCTNCASACKRCDEARPCERCIKYGLAETCVDGVRKERKKGIKRGPYKRKNRTSSGEGRCFLQT